METGTEISLFIDKNEIDHMKKGSVANRTKAITEATAAAGIKVEEPISFYENGLAGDYLFVDWEKKAILVIDVKNSFEEVYKNLLQKRDFERANKAITRSRIIAEKAREAGYDYYFVVLIAKDRYKTRDGRVVRPKRPADLMDLYECDPQKAKGWGLGDPEELKQTGGERLVRKLEGLEAVGDVYTRFCSYKVVGHEVVRLVKALHKGRLEEEGIGVIDFVA